MRRRPGAYRRSLLVTLFLGAASVVVGSEPAYALNVPTGWTAVDNGRAVLKPSDPSAGELIEIRIDGSTGAVEDLLFTLLAQGRKGRLKSSLPEGHANLLFDDGHLGRAFGQVEGTVAIWWVVIAHPEAVASLDSDALLKSQITSADQAPGEEPVEAPAVEAPAVEAPPALPDELEWGSAETVEVLPGGGDGSQWAIGDVTDEMLWGGAVEVPTNAYEWNPTGETEEWEPTGSLVGSWEGHYMRGMDRVRVKIRLDATGRIRLETRTGYGQSVEEGTWGTQGARLRIEPYGGRSRISLYERSGDQLRLTIDGKRATLMRKR